MAREALVVPFFLKVENDELIARLKDFEALVRADEREQYKWDIHSCGPTCKRYACVAMREAVEAEREACAKVCEETEVVQTTYCMTLHDEGAETLRNAAAAIRAMGNT
jgi:hypothetical protein